MQDTYRTISEPTEGLYKEKGSKFIALAYPVYTEDEVKDILAEVKKKYYDARHHCYAYTLGADKSRYRANDDGEPNHSAGDPILGQIRSADLSNVLVIVVRYFGGTKLGVSGLITAYKAATAAALEQATVVEQHETVLLQAHYAYPQMNDVMSLVKEYDLPVRDQQFELDCKLTLEVRKALQYEITAKLEDTEGVKVTILE
ncbi:IMPACT family protein [Pontibacter cellulosilyticus]|uniref:YigZ family protein n=1 Tax=Pontibacter cellulosilyticus TaxID=1720253 RepID=A0A923N7I9_9BACT|nr:YigZ family protein [Pontibacter cellulosilyticus]MBC5993209.1 YigZ family protein [Pontibacter cellulosilyticus]